MIAAGVVVACFVPIAPLLVAELAQASEPDMLHQYVLAGGIGLLIGLAIGSVGLLMTDRRS